ncbi:diguanylate cyclase domain-containing protein [Paenibacillus sp. Z6-24]
MDFHQSLLSSLNDQSQLRTLIDLIPEFIVLKDGQGCWLVCNKLVMDIYDLELEDYLNRTDLEIARYRPQYTEIFEYNHQTDEQVWTKGSPLLVEKSFVTPDGVHRIWEVMKTPIFDEYGNRHRLVIVSRDVTERKKAEEALLTSQEQYRLIAENMSDVITMMTPERQLQYVSPSLESMLGHSPEQFYQQERFSMLHPEDFERFIASFEKTVADRSTNIKEECRYRHASGHYLWFEMNMTYVARSGEDTDYVLIVSRNIMERKNHEQQLRSLAYMDPLTGVPNRRYLMNQMHQDMQTTTENGALLGILYLDIDRFKEVNDTLGHEAGDELLVQMVERISGELGPMDTIARIGGDEFVVILPLIATRSCIAELANRICGHLQQPWTLQSQPVMTGSSIGVSVYPQDGVKAEELLRYADRALYTAKRYGRGQVCFYTDHK